MNSSPASEFLRNECLKNFPGVEAATGLYTQKQKDLKVILYAFIHIKYVVSFESFR